MNRRKFMKWLGFGAVSVPFLGILPKMVEREKESTLNELLEPINVENSSRELAVQVFTSLNSEKVKQRNVLVDNKTWKTVTIKVPIENIVCRIGDRVLFMENIRDRWEGIVRGVIAISVTHSYITIVNPKYLEKVVVMVDGEIKQVWA